MKRAKAARILIVDDHPAVREAVRVRLEHAGDMTVCGEAADLPQALQLLEELQPDLAIVDITLKEGTGIELIKRAKGRGSAARFLVWSMFDERQYAERALRAGAMGYIDKQQSTSKLVEAIRAILAGNVYLSEEMTNLLLRRKIGGEDTFGRTPLESLSDRELEVLAMIGEGRKTADIAERLHLSVKTIETYRDRIRQKLSLADGAELARFAAQWILDRG